MSQDPYRYFRIEARELIEQLGKTILELEKAPSPDGIARLLRVAHTLKGAARVVKQTEIADRAHALEEAAGSARGSAAPLARERVDTLLALVDAMSVRLAALDAPPEKKPNAPAREDAPRVARADVEDVDDLIDGLSELHAQLSPVRRALGSVERAQRLAEVLVGLSSSPRGPGTGGGAPAVVSADAARSERHARATAQELREVLAGLERRMSAGLDLADRELAQVRRSAEQLRLTPADAMFTALERTARDAAQMLGKKVVFEGRGGDVRLDAQVLGAVQNALVQVVRNAVAHGIEPEAERAAAGKPSAGAVKVAIERHGRRVVFTATDDGRGIDLEAVRAVAQRRGLMSEATRALGPTELLRVLLAGGVSTAPSVTEVAGRGIGLDVVRETVQRLGGEVQVSTRPRAGTTVEMLVPLSLAAQEALLVEASGMTVALPLDAVEQATRIESTDLARTADGESLVRGDRALPFLPLACVTARAPSVAAPRAWSAVVVRGAGGAAAVGVDRLLGTRSVVLRPIPDLAPTDDVVAGATFDADGDPQIVLDPDALVRAVRGTVRPSRSEGEAPRRAPVLVVDDSLTTRMLERSILEAAGYEVHLAVSGEEGLEMARRARYALFLVDVEMPGIDGFTFVERTRKDAALRGVPAILVSSRSAPEDLRRGREVGAAYYMVKSEFDQVALLARIQELVE